MASVTLLQCWLHSAADPTDCIAVEVHAIEHDPQKTVTARQYVGGWFPVTTPGTQKTAKVTFGFCTDTQAAWLKAHQGLTLCYRDPRAEKLYGFYTDCVFTPSRMPNQWNVTLTVQGTYFSEAV